MRLLWDRNSEKTQLQRSGTNRKGPIRLVCRQSGVLMIPTGEEVRLDLEKEMEIGVVVIGEHGSHCTSFTLYGENEKGERIVLYENDVIDRYLYCAFDPVMIRTLILTVNGSDNGKPVCLREIEAWPPGGVSTDFRVTVYYPLETGSRYFTEHEEDEDFQCDLDLITDVIFIGGVRFTRDGGLMYDVETLRRERAALNRAIGKRPVRVWCCILNPQRKMKLSNRDSAHAIHRHMDRLTEELLHFCEEYRLDGIDFDWEFPWLPYYWRAHSKLLIRLSDALHQQGRMLSSALGPWGVLLNRRARESLDFVNVMAYDWPKNKRHQHGEFYSCHYFSAGYFLKKGFRKSQLLLGVPFYGNTCDKGRLIQRGYSSFEVRNAAQNRSVLNGRPFYFNGSHLIYSKSAYTRDLGFAGVMVWCGKDDRPRVSGLSLFDAMTRALK